jgi:hypothetical protein
MIGCKEHFALLALIALTLSFIVVGSTTLVRPPTDFARTEVPVTPSRITVILVKRFYHTSTNARFFGH